MTAALPEVTVHVIIPARNEEDCLGRCLGSLVGQQGIDFHITVVDDGSTDSTHAIAESFPGVEVISAPEPPPGVMGKCNALIAGARGSTAKWLLFTDADTFHLPGSLAAAVREAEERRVDLLSYSPEQEVVSVAERILMPLIFADLVRTYPPERVNDPQDTTVAANGQYILVRRDVYEELGGHQFVAEKLLEDVELARNFKVSGHRIWFRFGGGLVRTRMYRSFNAMREGWTKNLVLLFSNPLRLALGHLMLFFTVPAFLIAGVVMYPHRPIEASGLLALAIWFYGEHLAEVWKAHFPWTTNLLAFFGLPLYVSLLLRSYLHSHRRGAVTWKGRTYRPSAPERAAGSSTEGGKRGLKS
ncbi:MAG TPA: glycosyltransferase family 2 protein [Candidatus Angelobacter sp.]|nr:glycosyltransferase family 2 protein [Candidatus Angelobacter sp.]